MSSLGLGAKDWAEWGARELDHQQMESDDDFDADLGLPPDGPQVLGASMSLEDLDLGDLESPQKPTTEQNLEPVPLDQLPRLAAGGVDGKNSARSRSADVISGATRAVKIVVKTLGFGMFALVLFVSVMNWPPWIMESEKARVEVMTVLFAAGLFIVAVEDIVGINKSAMMMVMAAVMWTFLAVGFHPNTSEAGAKLLHEDLARGLEDVGSVLLFLLPAMGVVESIDHFDGFVLVKLIIARLTGGKKVHLLPVVCVLTFFLSAVIDNLTATIVAIKILRHLLPDDVEFRKLCGGIAVCASNAGGAWSPIGDVTTTMLWIQDKISPSATVRWLFIPSSVAFAVPLLGAMWANKPADTDDSAARHRKKDKKIAQWEQEPLHEQFDEDEADRPNRKNVTALVAGTVFILMVPALKMGTGLPPYLGMLLALGLMWLLTDVLGFVGAEEEARAPNGDGELEGAHNGPPTGGVVSALKKVDLTGLLFFTGVLLAVGALDSAGVLRRYADEMRLVCGDSPLMMTTLLGLSSALVDNVPLVEAAIDMFKETKKDNELWQLVALAAGTGGSCLSIGSIAGVTLMSMEGVGFIWYVRKISFWALLGYCMSIGTYQLIFMIV